MLPYSACLVTWCSDFAELNCSLCLSYSYSSKIRQGFGLIGGYKPQNDVRVGCYIPRLIHQYSLSMQYFMALVSRISKDEDADDLSSF